MKNFVAIFVALVWVCGIVFLAARQSERLKPCLDACNSRNLIYATSFEGHCFCREPAPVMPLIEVDP